MNANILSGRENSIRADSFTLVVNGAKLEETLRVFSAKAECCQAVDQRSAAPDPAMADASLCCSYRQYVHEFLLRITAPDAIYYRIVTDAFLFRMS
jgi:hypothetical protein